jgi:multisubunit Na+/H+ antiporter MnhE subunit
MDLELLNNVFFGFWYIFGDYFSLILGYGTAVVLLMGLTHILIRR